MKQRSLLRQMVEATGLYSLAFVAGRAAGILLIPVYTRYLTPADYGLMELLDLIGTVAGILLGGNFGAALFYYYFLEKEPETRNRFVSTSFLGSALVGVGSALLVSLGAAPLSAWVLGDAVYAYYVRVVLCGIATQMPVEAGIACLRVWDRPQAYLVLALARLSANVGATLILLVGFRIGLAAMLWGTLVSNCVTLAIVTWYVLRAAGARLDWAMLWKIIRYVMPLWFHALGEFVIHFADRAFLRHVSSFSEMGLYGLGYRMGMLVSYVYQPFSTYWRSQMMAIIQRPDGERTYVRVATYLTAGMSFTALSVSVLAEPLVLTLLDPRYARCARYVPALAGIYAIRVVTESFRGVLLMENRPDVVAKVTLVSTALCLTGYMALIPRYRFWGAIAATGAAFLAGLVGMVITARGIRRLSFEYGCMAKVGAIALAVWVLHTSIPVERLWQQWVTAATAAAVYPMLLLAAGVMEPDEKKRLRQIAMDVLDRLQRRRA